MNASAMGARLTFAACLAWAAVGAEPGPDDAKPTPTRLVLKLQDGSRIAGTPSVAKLPFRSDVTTAELPWKGIRSIELAPGSGASKLSFANGDHLKGIMGLDSIEMETLVGKVSIATKQIVSLRVAVGGGRGVVTEGLIGHWPLDGDAQDASGNGHHGANHGAGAIEDGRFGGAYRFGGAAGIDVGNLDLSGGTFTVSCWIRTTRAGVKEDWRNCIGKITDPGGGPFTMLLGDGRKDGGGDGAIFHIWNGGEGIVNLWAGKPNCRDGEWHLLTGTYGKGKQRFYVDGALNAEGAYDGVLPSNNGGVIIGGSNFGAYHRPWIGDIDDVRIYNRALSESEVEALKSD